MRPCLSRASREHVFLHFLPIFLVKLKSLEKSEVLSTCPSTGVILFLVFYIIGSGCFLRSIQLSVLNVRTWASWRGRGSVLSMLPSFPLVLSFDDMFNIVFHLCNRVFSYRRIVEVLVIMPLHKILVSSRRRSFTINNIWGLSLMTRRGWLAVWSD